MPGAVAVILERGNQRAAAGLTAKAAVRLGQHRNLLNFISNLDPLLERLKTPDSGPPRLERPPSRTHRRPDP